jgi:hypothetical protein
VDEQPGNRRRFHAALAIELGRALSVLEALLPQKPEPDVSSRQTAKARGGSAVVQVAGDARIGDIDVR